MKRNAVWETWWAEHVKLLLWYLHKGNRLSVNNENMRVMISPLKSSFPKTRLQEIACRCHEVLLTCREHLAPRIYATSFFKRRRSCTISCEQHPRSTLYQNSSTFCSFLKNAKPYFSELISPYLCSCSVHISLMDYFCSSNMWNLSQP